MKKEKVKTEISKAASAFGQLGGRSNVKKHGKEHMKEISKKALAKRWGKKVK